MSGPQADGAWARRGSRRGQRVLDAVALLLLLTLAAGAAWPIYASSQYLVVVAVAVLLGCGAAYAGTRWPPQRWWAAVPAAVAVYLVSVIPAAIPSSLWDLPHNLAYGLRQAIVAPVAAWKPLATVGLPVGSFEAMLVPAYLVFLVTSAVGYTLVWRHPARVPLASLLTGGALTFGLVMGRSAPSESAIVLGRQLAQPREVLVGVGWIVLTVLWLSWRALLARRRVAAVSGDGGSSRARRTATITRAASGVAMVVVAVVATMAVAPGWSQDRTVARSVIVPITVRPPQDSPLSSFRASFTPAGLDRELFTVSGAAAGTMVRIATLPHYDGESFTALDPGQPGGGFRQLAYRIDGVAGQRSQVTVKIADYHDVWLPTVGQATQVSFAGSDARVLTSAIFVDPKTTGVLSLAVRPGGSQGLHDGDSYALTYATPQAVSPTDGPAGLADPPTAEVYPQLFAWLKAAGPVGGTVAEVQALVDRMMQQSYLGHSLVDPSAGESAGSTTTWLTGLPAGPGGQPYEFRPSYAGHSISVIEDQVFAPMNESTVQCSDTVTQCAATVGDQEQYAVAAALIAEASGFPARIVLGAAVPADGVVRGRMVTAWAEIETESGTWAALTAEPRVDNSFVEDTTVSEPQTYQTPVDRQDAEQLAPPDQKAQDGATPPPAAAQDPPSTSLAGRWWPTIRTGLGGLGLLLLLGSPIVVTLAAKARRRQRRRSSSDPERMIAGGWQEYVDRAVDLRMARPAHHTRSELAALYGGSRSEELAARADRAVFADHEPQQADSERYWQLVEAEVAEMQGSHTTMERWRARLSWTSLRSPR